MLARESVSEQQPPPRQPPCLWLLACACRWGDTAAEASSDPDNIDATSALFFISLVVVLAPFVRPHFSALLDFRSFRPSFASRGREGEREGRDHRGGGSSYVFDQQRVHGER